MPDFTIDPPVVLSFSHLDPCGASGIQADIETLSSLGVHCAPICTSLSAQDTLSIHHSTPMAATLIIEQARAILEDMPVKAFKLGWLGNSNNIEAIHTILTDYPHIPVVFDPCLKLGEPEDDHFIQAIQALLLPQCDIVILNTVEAHLLAPEADNLRACASEIHSYDCEHSLITGCQNTANKIASHLYDVHGLLKQYQQQRIKKPFCGAGSTLSASITAYLSHDFSLLEAVQQAHKYTWESLNHGRRIGMGQLLPNRLYWAESRH
ncbi:hydroxymethylpyrimidine/phosphomethylpyrimidine kinase [Sinobacterium caligoides]|uniref:hydroxymethylpyrimidine kinase n=1 Tax=Sinobacterium caligoides TaxID=933926 RepID=A0A3N2DG67_9GAMM|nr:hydroxymethylpyrimidine/phosphomethylpyrimidine kinase [Sinobacterium caligoides]ROR98800.1 hydroxymethylpyrimidine/phosphomethylpyrimidine kinase [Sinobacterium caligoides]